jgi:hypothetical protein
MNTLGSVAELERRRLLAGERVLNRPVSVNDPD